MIIPSIPTELLGIPVRTVTIWARDEDGQRLTRRHAIHPNGAPTACGSDLIASERTTRAPEVDCKTCARLCRTDTIRGLIVVSRRLFDLDPVAISILEEVETRLMRSVDSADELVAHLDKLLGRRFWKRDTP